MSACLNSKTGRAGGAILGSGTTILENCSFSDNHAPLGPAVSNVVTVELNDTHFGDNTLWCDDDSLFLDWKNVSGETVERFSCEEVDSFTFRCVFCIAGRFGRDGPLLSIVYSSLGTPRESKYGTSTLGSY